MTVIEFLDELISEYKIQSDSPESVNFQDVKDRIIELEKENSALKDIIEIKTANLSIARDYIQKLKNRIKELKNGN